MVSRDGGVQCVVITGGASGIGKALAEALAGGESIIIAADRTFSLPLPAGPLVPGRVYECATDVTDENSINSLFDSLDAAQLQIAALVNSAGIGIFAPTAELSSSDWRRVIDVNLTGTFLCTREAIRRMLRVGRGRIVHIGSISADRPLPNNSAYACSKIAVRMLAQINNEEYAQSGVLSTVVTLGATYTPIWQGREDFSSADMLTTTDVVRVICHVLQTPASVRVDEIKLLPPKGVL